MILCRFTPPTYPILKFQFSSTTWINPMVSFTLNTNPRTSLPHSKDCKGFSCDLVIERLCHRFEKTSSCESIHCCSFTEFLGISVIFLIKIETVGNKNERTFLNLWSIQEKDSFLWLQQKKTLSYFTSSRFHLQYDRISCELDKAYHNLFQHSLRVVSSTFQIVQILVHSHFDQVSSILVQISTRTVAQMAAQIIVCLSV